MSNLIIHLLNYFTEILPQAPLTEIWPAKVRECFLHYFQPDFASKLFPRCSIGNACWSDQVRNVLACGALTDVDKNKEKEFKCRLTSALIFRNQLSYPFTVFGFPIKLLFCLMPHRKFP